MGKAMFYHLTRRPLEETLAMLLDKAHSAGWRVLVRGTSQERMQWLDDKLWIIDDQGFLPHGVVGGDYDAFQPVLLSAEPECPDAIACVMSVDGADVRPEEVATLERVCVLFDGNDPDALGAARGQWKALTAAGVTAEYWSEESGSWQKKAEAQGGDT